MTDAGLQRGAELLGDAFSPSSTWMARYWPGRHDAVGLMRDFGFDMQSGKFVYTGPTVEAPT